MVPSTNNGGTDHKGTTPLAPLPSAAPTGHAPLPAPTGGHVAIRPLRTYKDDLAEAIKKGGYSTASIQEAERKKKERVQVATPPPQRPAGVRPKPPKQIPVEEPRIAPATQLPPQPLPPSPTPAQIPPVSQKSGEERKTFFSQLLGHKKGAPDEMLRAPRVTSERPAATSTPIATKAEPFVPQKPTERAAPIPPQAPESPPSSHVRFIEEHAVERAGLPASNLPSWATPGDTKAERAQEEALRQKDRPAPPVFKPRLPLVTREAPTRGSAVSDNIQHSFPARSAVIAVASLFVIVGIGFGGYTLFKNTPDNGGPAAGSPSFISVADTITFDATSLSDVAFIDAYKTKGQETVPGQSTRSIVVTIKETGVDGKENTRVLQTSEFFTLATPTAPGILVRALGDVFTSGVRGSIGGNSGFIIAPVENYDRALGGLLSWESTMGTSLAPLLLSKASRGTPFTDKTIAGVVTRVLGSGEDALVYGFIDKKILLIARGEGAFGALADMIRVIPLPPAF